jgi:VanZ family protein
MKKKFEFYNKRIIRAILIALIIAVMVLIFILSAEDGQDSGGTSGGITETVLDISGIDASELDEEEFAKVEGFIRTSAHFSEYALLAFLSALLLATYKIKRIYTFAFSVAFAAFYAITDEIHQIFVPDRAAQISDWLVDVSGAALGASLVLLLLLIAEALKKRRKFPKKKIKKSKA